MGASGERRQSDEFVEPLFAGLRGADAPLAQGTEPPASPQSPDAPRPDPWTHPPRPQHPLSSAAAAAGAADSEGEPSPTGLFVRALLFVVALLAIAAAVYLVFGV